MILVRRAALAAILLLFTLSAGQVTAQSAQTLWTAADGPSGTPGGQSSSLEVGTSFHTDTAGSIVGVRFYKNPNSTTTHVGNLWSNIGTLLGTVTFAGETSSGWQEADFATPVAIVADTVYVVSYHTSAYRSSLNYFVSGVNSGDLHAPNDAGLYAYGNGPSLFPSTSYLHSNYWVDPVFVPGASATPTPTPSPTNTPAPTDTPTPGPSPTATSTPQPTSTPGPTNTPAPTATPDPNGFTCTEVDGFSVTSDWYLNGFIQAVADPERWQLRWYSGGSIDQWAAGADFYGWTDPANLVTHCASGSSAPDRVILNVSGDYRTDPVWWAQQTQLAIDYVRYTYSPGVRQIVVQPPVGGPSSSLCPTSDPLASHPWIRATYNAPYILAGFQQLLSTLVVLGPDTQIASCAGYRDWAGHLVDAHAVGQAVAAFYSLHR